MADFIKNGKKNNTRTGQKRVGDLASYVFDKVQPQARDLEEAVLGGMMLDKDAVAHAIEILKPESFYTEAHQHIFQAIHTLFAKSEPVDILTVTQQLRKEGTLEAVGGAFYVTQLTNRVGSTANIEYHARIIAEKYILRRLIRSSNEIIKDAYEETTDVFDLLDTAEQNLFSIAEQNLRRSYDSMGNLVSLALKQIEERQKNEGGLVGVPSGFSGLDLMTSGWQKSDLVIMAARPGMGKCLGKGIKVLMYSGVLKKVEDVVTGDLLMGDDSTPRRVKSIARGQERMYWVRQNKAMDYRVNESHILSLKCSQKEHKQDVEEVLNIEVRDYLEKSMRFKSNYKGYKVAVEFDERPLRIAPYYMGLCLGKNSRVGVSVFSKDVEIIRQRNYSHELDFELSVAEQQEIPRQQHALPYPLNELVVGNNPSIPEAYLLNSTANRLALLAGLIDNKGFYNDKTNGYEIVEGNENVAKQIKFLCDSLGFRTKLQAQTTNITGTNSEGLTYQVRCYGDINRIPVKLEHKKTHPRRSTADWRMTGIRLEFDKVDDYYGFEIDGNRLFLLEDMTVTHNTAITLSMARNAAVEFNKPVAIFSLEMDSLQLTTRLISAETGISGNKLKRGDLRPDEEIQLSMKLDKLAEAPMFIDDTPALNIFELRAKCRRLKMQHDIQMVVIDYLQLMSGTAGQKGNREQEISTISRSLKSIAKELSIPVIALSQLSRAVETRGGDKRPQLSDLRECITGDTLIYLADTGEYKKVIDLVGTSGFQVLAMDENYKMQAAECLDVWETGEKEVFEVTTQSGFKIKTSLNHPFYTIQGWQQLVDIKVGDHVATPRMLVQPERSIDLKEEEIILLAHMIGDGCYVKKQPIHYTSEDEASLDIVEHCAKSLWGTKTRRVKDVSSKKCYHVYLPAPYHLRPGLKNPFSRLLEKVGLEKERSYNKTIPAPIFKASLDQISLFIKHLWATDGGIFIRKGKGSSKIHYSSSSHKLVQGLKSLLLKFGITVAIQKVQKAEYRPNYHLSITGKTNILTFASAIGIFGSKSKILEELVKIMEGKKSNPNSDVISKRIWDKVRFLRKESQFTERTFQAAIDTKYCGTSLYKSNISRQRLERVADVLASKQLKNLAQSDIKWDKIVSIEHIGKEMTYDLHVDKHHNFVANNFIIHNSGAIEQDADMVIFLYRPEYYGFDTDAEGNSLKGVSEIIIAKHRNGALGTVKVRFIAENAKFVDLETNDDDFQGLTPLNDIITVGSKINGGGGNASTDFDDVPF